MKTKTTEKIQNVVQSGPNFNKIKLVDDKGFVVQK